MKYEIDGETADGICRDVLGDTIKFMKKSIKDLKAELKLRGSKAPSTKLEDLKYDQEMLESLVKVHEFFGGKLK